MRGGVLPAGRACAVAPVDRPICVEEERGPSLIIVELEQTQIHIIDGDDAHTYELLLERFQVIARTNNLFVKLLGGRSGDAAEHDEQRLARGLGPGIPFLEVVINPVLADIGVFEVSLQIRLGIERRVRRKDHPEYERNREFGLHRSFPKTAQMANQ